MQATWQSTARPAGRAVPPAPQAASSSWLDPVARAGGFTHDLANVLSAVLGYSDLLLHQPGALQDPVRSRRYLELIHLGASDALDMVDRFHSPEGDGPMVSADLPGLVRQAVALAQPRWTGGLPPAVPEIAVRLECGGVPPIHCHPSALREALVNLLRNAADAMEAGGTITVRAYRGFGTVTLEVCDTGSGMSDEVRRRCLDPFFTTKGRRGTGLGLAMVDRIVRRHGGALEVDSAEGRGTTVRIRLPAAGPALRPQPAASGPAPARARCSARRILVVDDDPAVRQFLDECLTLQGYAVDAAPGAAEALQRFQAAPYDLVITDLTMPGIDGAQLAPLLKALSPRTPVILLSGWGAAADAHDQLPAGVDRVMTKPVRLAGLREAVQALVGPPAGAPQETAGPNHAKRPAPPQKLPRPASAWHGSVA